MDWSSNNDRVNISTEVFKQLCRTRIAGVQRQVFDTIILKTWGSGLEFAPISISDFMRSTAKTTIAGRVAIKKAIGALIAKKLIIKVRDGPVSSFSVQQDCSLWKPAPVKGAGVASRDGPVSEEAADG